MRNQSDTTSLGSDLSGRTLGGYRLLHKLGSGGMADVYLAEQFSLNRRVAVKALRPATLMYPEAVDRFAITRPADSLRALYCGLSGGH